MLNNFELDLKLLLWLMNTFCYYVTARGPKLIGMFSPFTTVSLPLWVSELEAGQIKMFILRCSTQLLKTVGELKSKYSVELHTHLNYIQASLGILINESSRADQTDKENRMQKVQIARPIGLKKKTFFFEITSSFSKKILGPSLSTI